MGQITKKILSKIRRGGRRTALAVFIVGFAAIGAAALTLTRAAGSFIATEPELGSLAAPAAAISDTTASGGKHVKFSAPPTPPTPPPLPPPPPPFVFTAAGDHANTSHTTTNMDRVGTSGSNFYLALGDLSYDSGGESAWCSKFKSRFNHVEVLAGNHDVGESAGGDIDNYIRFCPYTLTSPLTGSYGKQYYFDYPRTSPRARFIMIAPGIKGSLNINYGSGGAGYVFTQNAINDAQAKGIKWIIVGMHKNCISTGEKTCEVGTAIMNLLINERVDLILQSHDHNYQRSHALDCITTNSVNSSCIADSGSDNLYVKGRGPVIVINGEFGRSLYDVTWNDSESGYFAKISSTTYGFSKYTVSDTELSSTYIRTSTGTWADSFKIQK